MKCQMNLEEAKRTARKYGEGAYHPGKSYVLSGHTLAALTTLLAAVEGYESCCMLDYQKGKDQGYSKGFNDGERSLNRKIADARKEEADGWIVHIKAAHEALDKLGVPREREASRIKLTLPERIEKCFWFNPLAFSPFRYQRGLSVEIAKEINVDDTEQANKEQNGQSSAKTYQDRDRAHYEKVERRLTETREKNRKLREEHENDTRLLQEQANNIAELQRRVDALTEQLNRARDVLK